MNTFDIIITALLLFGFVRGMVKGLFVEVATIIALIAGVYGAIHFSYFLSNLLGNRVGWDPKYVSLAAFAVTFIGIVIVISLLGKAFTSLADFASLGFLNKLLGGVFGALKIGLICSIVFIFFGKMNDTIPFVKKETLDNSILYHRVRNIAPTLFPSIIKNADTAPEIQLPKLLENE